MTIGAIVPLTGDLSSFGAAGNAALELAVAQINEAAGAAGLEGEVELAAEDGETKEDAAKAAAEKLTRDDDVSCIVGDWASSSTISVAESVTIDAGVPMISPASTAGSITALDDDGTVFRTVPSDDLQASLLAQAISEDLGGSGTVSVAARNNAYGSGLAKAFEAAAAENGLELTGDPVLMDPDTAQADSEARQITAEDADAWLIIDYPATWQKLGPALARTGKWDPAKTWGSDGIKDATLPQTAGKQVTEGMRGTAPVAPESDIATAFDELWTAENTDQQRQTYDADNFDAAMLCFLAAVAADSSDPEEIAEHLQDVSSPDGMEVTFENLQEGIEALQDGEEIDYQGVTGPIDWDENGDPSTANYEIWTYKGGKLTSTEQIPFSADGETGAEDDSTDSADTTSATSGAVTATTQDSESTGASADTAGATTATTTTTG